MVIGVPNAVVTVPLRYPTSQFYLDESGSKATASKFFVVGGIKLRQPGWFNRALQDLRDRHDFRGEFKFSEITRGTLPIYYDLIDRLQESDAHLTACVVDGSVHNPFKGRDSWRAHADVASQLLVGCINRRELVGVALDGISTPRGESLEDTVRELTNQRLRATAVITSICLDSKTCDAIQVADLVSGAVAFERRRESGESGNPNSNKAKVAARLGAAFDCAGFADGRSDRVSVATFRPRPERRRRLSVVQGSVAGGATSGRRIGS